MGLFALAEAVEEGARFDSLKTIRSLEIADAIPDWEGGPNYFSSHLIDMIDATISWVGTENGPLLRSIKRLAINYCSEDKEWPNLYPLKFISGIHNFGQLCGSELWSITVSLPLLTFSEDELAYAFDTYPYVEEITIQGGLLEGDHSQEVYASAAKTIESRSRNLQKLNFRKLDEIIVNRPNVTISIEQEVGEGAVVSAVCVN